MLIHRRSLAFCLTVAAVLLGWAALAARPPVVSAVSGAAPTAVSARVLKPGFVRLPVRFADGEMAGLLHPGELIELWASDPRTQRSRVIVRDAEVLEVPAPAPGSVSAGRQSRLVVVGIHVTEVETVTRFNAIGVLTYVVSH